ncbi:flagellin N-terminal helical domain-containing protein [Bradyrhizobium cenepequi]
MSGIVLSSSVRQNLLSLQSTADLLATTQSRLSTGKKVNSALDNPTNFFTAAALDNRASDINNLLDGIGNGVQVLQAANTGITSLQKLVDSAKSIANQALQATTGYTKSAATSAASGATAANLLGTTAQITSSVTGSSVLNNVTQTFFATAGAAGTALNNNRTTTAGTTTGSTVQVGGVDITGAELINTLTGAPGVGDTLKVNGTDITFTTATTGQQDATHVRLDDTINSLLTKVGALSGGSASIGSGQITVSGASGASVTLAGTGAGLSAFGLTANTYNGTSPAAITANTKLAGVANSTSDSLTSAFTTADTIVANNTTIRFYDSGAGGSAGTAANSVYLDLATANVGSLTSAINTATGGTSAIDAVTGAITLTTGTTADISLSGTGVAKIGLGATYSQTRTSAPAVAAPIDGSTKLKSNVGTNSLSTAFATTDTITVNTKTIAFYDSGAGGSAGTAANTTYLDLATATVADVLSQIDAYSGGTGSAVAGGKTTLNAGTTAALTIGGTGLAKLGLSAGTTPASTPANPGLSGQTLTIGSTGGGIATNITFGTGSGQVSTLNDLNNALAANNLQASINSSGAITLTTTNDAASYNIGLIGGTSTNAGGIFAGVSASIAIADPNSQATRAGLVAQYNQVIDQIKTTAQDSSFNGVNLLNGDSLSLTFNETGSSKLKITGVSFDPAGLGLSALTTGKDFIDNAATNKVLTSLTNASSTLRSQASAFGSNLSIVQIRQDFSKNLINVLQTGSSNLTLADTNEEAANSQALSTRQSIAVSALALANQSQQSVLQLLR